MRLRLADVARKQWAFLRRGFLTDTSYTAAFAVQLLSGFVPLLFFFILARLIDPHDPRMQRYDGGYFPFVAVGIAVTQYFARAVSSLLKRLREAQVSGVLESLLSAGTKPAEAITYESVYSFLFAVVHLVVVLSASVLFLGLDLSRASWALFWVGFALSVAGFIGIALIGAAALIHLKSPEPFLLVLNGFTFFLAGTYFPVALLPPTLRVVANLFPVTHALEVARLSLLGGADFGAASRALLALSLAAVLLLPIGVIAVSITVDRGRRAGSLGQH